MSEITFLDLVKETIFLILLLCAPVLTVGMVIGLIISLIQSVTQIQEATLTFVPKIFATLGVIIVISPWMLHIFLDHASRMLSKMIVLGHPS